MVFSLVLDCENRHDIQGWFEALQGKVASEAIRSWSEGSSLTVTVPVERGISIAVAFMVSRSVQR